MASILKVDTIQDQDGNNIINESANTITIGASGNTITIPSGATLANSGIVTGFESTGIDDNATSTAITIDSNETSTLQCSAGDSNFALLAYHPTGTSTRTIAKFQSNVGGTQEDKVVIQTSGNVGIGTSSPSYSLEVVSSNSSTAKFKGRIVNIDGASASDSPRLNLSLDGTDKASILLNRTSEDLSITNVTANDLFFGTNNTERMRIDSSGNVGIGTSSPGVKLEIKGADGGADTQAIRLMENSEQGGFIKYDGDVNELQLGGYNSAENTGIRIARNDATTYFNTNGSERMRIDSSGNVGIGTSSPTRKLEVSEAGTAYFRVADTANSVNIDVISASSGGFIGTASSDPFIFQTANAERMRIDSSGNFQFNKTVKDFTIQGSEIRNVGQGTFTNSGDTALILNRLSNDGVLQQFYQNTILEGNISVSGSTVSYNGFTGTHWSRFTDNSTPTILKGTVLETLDEMCDWYNLEFNITTQDEDGNDVTTPQKIPHVLTDSQSNGDVITYNHKGTDYQATIVKEVDIKHMKSKVSDTVDAKNVYGVFIAYDEDGEGYNDFYVASVGSFVVRIKANETIAKGDLLQSNGDGTAKVQSDDAVRSSSFAKVLSTTIIETYEDGSYLVPCSLMC